MMDMPWKDEVAGDTKLQKLLLKILVILEK